MDNAEKAVEDERTADADAFVDEVDEAPVRFAWRGREYELPAGLPAIVVVKSARLARRMAADEDVPGEDVVDMLDALFGGDMLDAILTETKTTADDLGRLLEEAMIAYGIGPSGNREARRAQGRGGRPTSTSGRRGRG